MAGPPVRLPRSANPKFQQSSTWLRTCLSSLLIHQPEHGGYQSPPSSRHCVGTGLALHALAFSHPCFSTPMLQIKKASNVLAKLGGVKSCDVVAAHLPRCSFPPLTLCTFVAIVLSLRERGSRHSLCLQGRLIHLLQERSFCRYRDFLLRHVRLITTCPSTVHASLSSI
jgi:hypothetical protein